MRAVRGISPSPGTPGEGRGEGLLLLRGRALTLPSPGVPGEGSRAATFSEQVRERTSEPSNGFAGFNSPTPVVPWKFQQPQGAMRPTPAYSAAIVRRLRRCP